MAKTHSIEPFPTNIDRDYFGAWLSGFTDGEGSFTLRQDVIRSGKTNGMCVSSAATFEITLRDDDLPVLRLIQSFFGCGTLLSNTRIPKNVPNAKPRAIFKVHRVDDLSGVIVQHFDAFPLFAKKGRDYAIWRKAVIIMKTAKRKRHPRESGKGTLPRWTKDEIQQFANLASALRTQRIYQSPLLPIPASDGSPMPTLFD